MRDKCEICGNKVSDKDIETVTYQGTTTYVCGECMHRIITLMTVMKGYKEMKAMGLKVNEAKEIDQLKKIIKGV